MTPEERQILTGLFDRIRANSGGQRDPQAEAFITQAVQAQPWAPYLLAQNVIVMEQGLQASAQRIQELEGQLQAAQGAAGQGGGSFLGNVGRSIFGSSAPQPMQGAAPPQPRYAPPPQQNYAPPQQAGPWGQAPAQAQASGGGGFLKGALGAAAGVAGGMLLADSVRGMFGGHGGGMFGGGVNGQGESIVNNYYSDGTSSQDTQTAQDIKDDADADQDTVQDASDDAGSYDSGGGGDSGSYDA